MSKITGSLTTDEVALNRISATWTISTNIINYEDGPLTSPSFILQNNGHSIQFNLIVECMPNYSVNVIKSDNTRDAKAIITLAVQHESQTPAIEVKGVHWWKDIEKFSNLGLPPHRYDKEMRYRYDRKPSIIKCYITWLGFNSVKATKVSHHHLCLTKLPFDNELTPNVKLVIGDKEIPAHKTVLTLHSPVFMGMFETPMREAKENRVVIEDIDFDTMQVLIGMIYSGDDQALNDKDTAIKVLTAAEKYQMSIVKRACEAKLQLKLEHFNALELFKEAEKHNTEDLFRTCLEFVIVHKKLPFAEVRDICLKQTKYSAMLIDLLKEKLEMIF